MRHAGVPLVLIVSIALVACSPSQLPGAKASPASGADANMLPRYHWVLDRAENARGARIEAMFARPDAPLQLDFAEGRIAVANACNASPGRTHWRMGICRSSDWCRPNGLAPTLA